MSYQFIREPLNYEECDRMVNACKSFAEKLVVWVLLDTGLRVGESDGVRVVETEVPDAKPERYWYVLIKATIVAKPEGISTFPMLSPK